MGDLSSGDAAIKKAIEAGALDVLEACAELAEDVYAEADASKPSDVCCAHWRQGYEAAANEIAGRIRARAGGV